jgi:hypothetical protein
MRGSELAASIAGERKAIRGLCKAALSKGLLLSYSDGESWPVKQTANLSDIMAQVHSTDEALIRVRDADGNKRVTFFIVYGNSPEEVISDYSYPEADEELANELYRAAI